MFFTSFCHTGDLKIVGGMTVTYDLAGSFPQFTLTCVTRGGPATSVIWIKNSFLIRGGKSTTLDDPVTAQYTHTLRVHGWLGGLYQCIVTNDKPSRAEASYQGTNTGVIHFAKIFPRLFMYTNKTIHFINLEMI